MPDIFEGTTPGLSSPLEHLADILPNDAADLAQVTRALYVGGAGDVRLTTLGGETVTLRGLATGWHPLRVSRVLAAGTTASDLVGAW